MKLLVDRMFVRDVSFSFGQNSLPILEHFSLEMQKPGIISLLGLNGSGKTTFLLLLLGYLKPASGAINLEAEGKPLDLAKANGQIGYLPQRENIPFDSHVVDYVMLGRNYQVGLFGAPNSEDKHKCLQVMRYLRLESLADRRLSSISGGELQRVRIARLLAQDPQIILMDEPSSHLDIKSRQEMLDLIGEFKRMGKLVIFSTHDPLDALQSSDLAILMKKGEKTIAGPSQDVITSQRLTDLFDTRLKINKLDGRQIITVENGQCQGD